MNLRFRSAVGGVVWCSEVRHDAGGLRALINSGRTVGVSIILLLACGFIMCELTG